MKVTRTSNRDGSVTIYLNGKKAFRGNAVDAETFALESVFDADVWIAQELAKATSAADADRYLAMGPEFTKDYHHRLAEKIRAKFPTAERMKAREQTAKRLAAEIFRKQ